MTMDLIKMVLAKADLNVVEYYEKTLVDERLRNGLGKELRNELMATINHVLKLPIEEIVGEPRVED